MFGLCVGNVVALPSLSIQREFAAASFRLVLGLSVAIGQVGYLPSPALLGLVRDLTGGARAVLGVCVRLQVVPAFLIIDGRLERRLARQRRGWRNGRCHQDRVVRPHL